MLRRILSAAALVCAVLAAPAHATEYDWRPAGQISQLRTEAAAAVLHDGRVLLAGGRLQEDLATVELYDPSIQAWSAGPSLGEPRRRASAVTLHDGRVLVLGGDDAADRRVAELFDPATGTWTRAADSRLEHVDAPGFVLDDGRVLFFIGSTYSSDAPSGEIYDPARDTWSLIAKAHAVSGGGQAIVRLRDGRFLVVDSTYVSAGGQFNETPLAELYDAGRNAWTAVAAPRYVNASSVAALLPDGRALVAGGHPLSIEGAPYDATAQRKSELFDPATGTWTPTGDLHFPRTYSSTLSVLADGQIVAAGGIWATIGGPIGQRRIQDTLHERTAETFDVAANAWQALPEMVHTRYNHVAAPLADGSLLVAGGFSGAEGFGTTAAERLVPRPVVPAGPTPPSDPAPPPAERPATTPRKRGTLRLVSAKRIKLPRSGTLTLKLRCSAGGAACSDRITLRGRGRRLAQRTVSVRAGKTVSVRFKLGATARRALRHRSTRVTLTLRRQSGTPHVTVRG